MLAVQKLFPFARPLASRRRSVRAPFRPSQHTGVYRLPHAVHDRLAAALAPFRNREAAFTLAVFIARYHSAPGRVVEVFPLDRRALAEHPELELTEAKIRRAIMTLEAVGFLDRALPSPGSTYQATEDGLHRKPIKFVFGSDFAPLFISANERARAAKGGVPGERRTIPAESARRPSMPSPVASPLKSPKSKSVAFPSMSLGDLSKGQESGIPPKTFDPDPKLEAALDRLLQGIRQSRGG